VLADGFDLREVCLGQAVRWSSRNSRDLNVTW